MYKGGAVASLNASQSSQNESPEVHSNGDGNGHTNGNSGAATPLVNQVRGTGFINIFIGESSLMGKVEEIFQKMDEIWMCGSVDMLLKIIVLPIAANNSEIRRQPYYTLRCISAEILKTNSESSLL